jgi:peroxiredoxin
MLQRGEYVPWYNVQTTAGQQVQLHTLGGRYVVMCFFESSANPFSRRVLDDIDRHGERFGEDSFVFFGITVDPRDAQLQPRRERGIYFFDTTRDLSRIHGAASNDGPQYLPLTIILDPMLRVASVLPFDGDPETYVPRLLDTMKTMPSPHDSSGYAPIIILPNVFEPEFCRALIRLYEQHGGHDIGMMLDVGGKTIRQTDHRIKCRLDHEIVDQEVMQAAGYRVARSLIPEVRRAFQFKATRMERHIVACYDAATSGHFSAHRDNLTAATAHRKFAVTINLNVEEYEGGDLCFPEYGSRQYRGPTGGAVVFSCTLLHEALPVTKGRRYAYLPFLYDEEGYQQYVTGRAAAGHFP